MVLDINGAIALIRAYKDSVLTVFVKRDKEACIRSILERNTSRDDTVRRLVSLEAEFANEELCDVTITNNADIQSAAKQILEYL